MTDPDRKLLELAAKASGLPIGKWVGLREWSDEPNLEGFYLDGDNWNPLTDDGDAFRLAVKLGIGLGFEQETVSAYQHYPHDDYFVEYIDEQEPAAATRRAIVRAAAAIGEQP